MFLRCGDIIGYDVRLCSQSAQHNVTRQIGSNRTFYIITEEDNFANYVQVFAYLITHTFIRLIGMTSSLKSYHSQVRVVSVDTTGDWSKEISFGKELASGIDIIDI